MSARITARLAIAEDLREIAADLRDDLGAKLRDRLLAIAGRVETLEGLVEVARAKLQDHEQRLKALEASHG
jgi:hypothetical protein